MANRLAPSDFSELQGLLDIAREVTASRRPRLAKSRADELAIVTPLPAGGHLFDRHRETGLIGEDDPLWNFVGMSDARGPTAVSENKHPHVAEVCLGEKDPEAVRR